MRPHHAALPLALLVSSAAAQTFAELGLRHFPDVGPLLTVCAADFDQDGDQDLYVSGIDLNDLPVETILWNDGHAVFTADRSFLPPTVVSAENSWAPDWDGDGDPDLLLQSTRLPTGGSRISLYRNDGTRLTDITSTLPASFANTVLTDVRTLDLGGDGDLDLVASGHNALYLLRNDGATGFVDVSAQLPSDPAMAASRLTVVDRDGDADPDLLIANLNGTWLLDNSGASTFTDVSSGSLVGLGRDVIALAVADLDGDGDDDLVARYDLDTLARLLNDGSGRFTARAYASTWLANLGVAMHPADLDGDGDVDLAVAVRFWTQDVVLLNDGSGGMTEVPLPAKGALSADGTVTDLDGNGTPDFVVAAATVITAQARQPFALLNDGAANFTPITDVLLAGGHFASGDVDADGDVDLLSGAGLFLNDGVGTLHRAPFGQTPHLPTSFAVSDIVVSDVDGDGDLDAVITHGSPYRVSEALWINDGTGHFTDASANIPWEQLDTADAELADLDGDGDLDLLLADAAGRHRLYVNDGRGVFTDASARLPLLPAATHLAVADVDGDGDLDTLWSLAGYGLLALARNDGTGNLTLSGTLPPSQVGGPMVFADLDHDGDCDLVVANPFVTTLEALQNDGTGTFTVWSARVLPPLTAPPRISTCSTSRTTATSTSSSRPRTARCCCATMAPAPTSPKPRRAASPSPAATSTSPTSTVTAARTSSGRAST